MTDWMIRRFERVEGRVAAAEETAQEPQLTVTREEFEALTVRVERLERLTGQLQTPNYSVW